MADSYSDFLNLAETLGIPLNTNDVSTIAPQLQEPQSNLDTALSGIVSNIKQGEFNKNQGQAMSDALGIMDLMEQEGNYNVKDLAEDMEKAGIITLDPDTNIFSEGNARRDAADYLAREKSFSKIPADDRLPYDFDIKLKDKPPIRSKDKKGDAKKEEKVKEDDRPKGLKDYLKDIMSDGDSLIALGSAIARGEGLVGGLQDFNEARKATKALQRELATQDFERKRQTKLDEYTIAAAQMDIAYKQSQLTTDEIKNAQSAALFEATAEGIDPTDPNLTEEQISKYYAILNKKMDMIINKEKPMTTGAFGEQIAMQAIQDAVGGEGTGAVGQGNKQITESYKDY